MAMLKMGFKAGLALAAVGVATSVTVSGFGMVWGVLTALGCPVWARWANAGGRKCAPYSVYRTGQKGGGESAGFRRRETPRSMWRGAARGLKSKFAESASSQCPSGGLRRIRRTGTTWPNCNYILQSILLLNYDATYSFLSCKLQPSKPTALKLDALLQTALQPTAFETYSFATTCVLLLPCSFFYGFTALLQLHTACCLLLLHTACFYCILLTATTATSIANFACILQLHLLLVLRGAQRLPVQPQGTAPGNCRTRNPPSGLGPIRRAFGPAQQIFWNYIAWFRLGAL